MKIREFSTADGPATFKVFYAAVHKGAAGKYTDAERSAWAPSSQMPDGWSARHAANIAYVAEIDGKVTGFMTLTANGYLDMAFVLPEAMGTGVANSLYAAIEARASATGLSLLTTDASHLAQPFFAKHGWKTLAAQSVSKGGQTLENFRMEKPL